MADHQLLVGLSLIRHGTLFVGLQALHDVGPGVGLLTRVLHQPLHLSRHRLEEGELRQVARLLSQLRVSTAQLQLREFRYAKQADDVEEEVSDGRRGVLPEEHVDVAVFVDTGDHVHEEIEE